MPKINIPELGEYFQLEKDWSFVLDFHDSTNEKLDYICREARISGNNYKIFKPYIQFKSLQDDPKYISRKDVRTGYNLVTLPKGTIFQLRKVVFSTLQQKKAERKFAEKMWSQGIYDYRLSYDYVHIWLRTVPKLKFINKIRLNVSLSDFNSCELIIVRNERLRK